MSRYVNVTIAAIAILIVGVVLGWNYIDRDEFWKQYSNERFGYTALVPKNTSNLPVDDFMYADNEKGDTYDYRWFADYSTWEKPVYFGNVSCYESLPNLSSLPMLGIEADTYNEPSMGNLSLKEFTDLIYSQIRPMDIVESLTSINFLDKESFTFSAVKSGPFSLIENKYIFIENQMGDTCIIELPISDYASDYDGVSKLRQEWIESFNFTDR